jgi:hypothetical protein
MNWKEAYTKIFLKEQGKSANEVTIKEFMPLWWKNTRDKGASGLRLTEAGFDLINQIDLATYDVPYPKDMPLTTQVIIFLDKFIDCPYYISPRSIIVTSEKKAVELSLFSGDLRKYGLTKAMSRTVEKGE